MPAQMTACLLAACALSSVAADFVPPTRDGRGIQAAIDAAAAAGGGRVALEPATCRNGIHEQGVSPRRDDMVGTPAFVRATCGKGEIIACNCHPEASPGTRELVVAMIKALTGREIHPPAKYFRRYTAFGKGPLMDAVRSNE